jgi:hypothetical protein
MFSHVQDLRNWHISRVRQPYKLDSINRFSTSDAPYKRLECDTCLSPNLYLLLKNFSRFSYFNIPTFKLRL